MIRLDQIIAVRLTKAHQALALYHAEKAVIGGVSRVREGEARAENNPEDQLVGQVAQLAFSLYQFGSDHPYRVSRWHANAHPKRGDGGSDIPGLNLDVKGRRFYEPHDFHDYLISTKGLLPVRPWERHRDFIYVLAWVPLSFDRAYLVGWLDEASLPDVVDSAGTYRGAFTFIPRELNPLPKLKWWQDGENGAVG